MPIISHNRLIIIFCIAIGCIVLATAQDNPRTIAVEPANITSPEGWSCDDFPCEDDIDGFLKRIQVPDGFTVSHVGQFSGQPMQIVYGNDGRLYGTILEKGTRRGAVYVMNPDGTTERVSPRFGSPVGIAFDENGKLYVSSRLNSESGGVVWEVQSSAFANVIVDNLPCCYAIDNQPNGMIFGEDGLLYLGVGSTSDRGESQTPESERFATSQPFEASILQINVNTGEIQPYAEGIRNPYDLDFTSNGQLYTTDNGLTTGQGDRILQVQQGAFYGFPFWRSRGCHDCPARQGQEDIAEDWLLLTDYTLPRGITVYDGQQFPENFLDTLFVAFWNGMDYSQRIVWINPDDLPTDDEEYIPQAFVTGLVRPVDVTVAPDGSLVIADFIYGHIWRVSYDATSTANNNDLPPVIQTVTSNNADTSDPLPPIIATVVSNSNDDVQVAPSTPTPNQSGFVFATATPSN